MRSMPCGYCTHYRGSLENGLNTKRARDESEPKWFQKPSLVIRLGFSADVLRSSGVHSIQPDFVGSKREMPLNRARHHSHAIRGVLVDFWRIVSPRWISRSLMSAAESAVASHSSPSLLFFFPYPVSSRFEPVMRQQESTLGFRLHSVSKCLSYESACRAARAFAPSCAYRLYSRLTFETNLIFSPASV